MSNSTQQVDSSDDVSGGVVIGGAISIALSIIFFSLRVVSQRLQKRRFDNSDALLVVSLLITVSFDVLMIWATNPPIRLGRHTDPRDALQFKVGQQMFLATEPLYTAGLALIKLSFLSLYLRLFPGKLYRRVIYFFCFIIIAWLVVVLFMAIFQCQPIEALWTLDLRDQARCLPLIDFLFTTWIPHIFTDIVILILPQVHVWKLQIDTRSRVALAATFLVGVFSIIANIIRVTAMFRIDTNDLAYTATGMSIWSELELASATICASLVTMRPLLVRLFRRSANSKPKTNGYILKTSSRKGLYQLSDMKPRLSVDRSMNSLVSSLQNFEESGIVVTDDTHAERDLKDNSTQVF